MKRIKYYDIENGTSLLRVIETPTTLKFEMIGHEGTGQWRDGTNIGVRYTVECSEIEAEEITRAAAAKLAANLGGALPRKAARLSLN